MISKVPLHCTVCVASCGLAPEERRVGEREMSASRSTEQAERVGDEVRRPRDPYEHVARDQRTGLRARGQREDVETVLSRGQRGNR